MAQVPRPAVSVLLPTPVSELPTRKDRSLTQPGEGADFLQPGQTAAYDPSPPLALFFLLVGFSSSALSPRIKSSYVSRSRIT